MKEYTIVYIGQNNFGDLKLKVKHITTAGLPNDLRDAVDSIRSSDKIIFEGHCDKAGRS